MKIPLSDRLMACCAFVQPGDRVADVGCDHGYTGIYLLKNGIASYVYASDVREMPLQSAMRNSEKYGVGDKMTFYLSDGVCNIPRDFDCLICAGMGADTMISILNAAPWLKNGKYRLVLQCQSKRPELRKYLYRQGFAIRRETLARDGKFIYPVLEAVYAPGGDYTEANCYLSLALRESGSNLLPAFCERVISGLRQTVAGLASSDSEKYRQYKEILEELTHEYCE